MTSEHEAHIERQNESREAILAALALVEKILAENKAEPVIAAGVRRNHRIKMTLADFMREIFLQAFQELDMPMEDLLKSLAFGLANYHHSEFKPETLRWLETHSGLRR